MNNIVIVGFMGTGKTAVARQLASSTGKRYISIDDVIVEKEERPIKDIFKDDGEVYFRKVEKETVKEVSEEKDLVVDTGGGVVLDKDNMEVLSGGGIVVCLWANPETIYERTKNHGHRPLLNVDDPKGRIKELLEYRRPFYEKAQIHVETDGKSINEIVDIIQRRIDEEQ